MGYRKKAEQNLEQSCSICGTETDLHVHHIDGDRSNNSLDNLAFLCGSCHGSVHQGVDGFEEWTERLLPNHRRTRTVHPKLDQEHSRDLGVIENITGVDNAPDATRLAIREYAAQLSEKREIWELADEIRNSNQVPTAEVVVNALEYRMRMEKKCRNLVELAMEEGLLSAPDIAEVLDDEEVPVKYDPPKYRTVPPHGDRRA